MQIRHGSLAQLGGRGAARVASPRRRAEPRPRAYRTIARPRMRRRRVACGRGPTPRDGVRGGAGTALLRRRTCRRPRSLPQRVDSAARSRVPGRSGSACAVKRPPPRIPVARRRAGGLRRVGWGAKRWWRQVQAVSRKGGGRWRRPRCAAHRRQERPGSCPRAGRGVPFWRQLHGIPVRRRAREAAREWTERPRWHRPCGGHREAGPVPRGSGICAVRAGGAGASAATGPGTAQRGWRHHRGWAGGSRRGKRRARTGRRGEVRKMRLVRALIACTGSRTLPALERPRSSARSGAGGAAAPEHMTAQSAHASVLGLGLPRPRKARLRRLARRRGDGRLQRELWLGSRASCRTKRPSALRSGRKKQSGEPNRHRATAASCSVAYSAVRWGGRMRKR